MAQARVAVGIVINQAKQQLTDWSGARLLAPHVVIVVFLAACGCLPRERPRDARSDAAVGQRAPAAVRSADNSECLICHMDFKDEELSAEHEKAGVGCTDCHGSSLAHGDDELNITPPDKLFGRAEIDSFCKDCHSTHMEGRVYDDFVKKWHSRRRPNGRMILDDSVCTDCHGNHAILRVDQQSAKGGLD